MPFTIRILTPITPISPQTSSLDSLLNAYLETLRYQERLFALLCRNYASEIAPQCGSKPAFKSSYKETPKQVRPRMPFWRKKSDKKQFEKHVSSPSLHPLPSLAAELRERKEKKHFEKRSASPPSLAPSSPLPLLSSSAQTLTKPVVEEKKKEIEEVKEKVRLNFEKVFGAGLK